MSNYNRNYEVQGTPDAYPMPSNTAITGGEALQRGGYSEVSYARELFKPLDLAGRVAQIGLGVTALRKSHLAEQSEAA